MLVEYHVGDAVDNGVLPLAVGADQLAQDDMGLYVLSTTSSMIRCSFFRLSSLLRYSGVRSFGKLVSPM